jgi:hypothetical protein
VIVAELDIERIAVLEAKADPPLIIDRDGVLARTIDTRQHPAARVT